LPVTAKAKAKPSQVKSLVAYERIRDMILTGDKLPGARLVVADLAEELGIGQGPVREAVMRLDRVGLVRSDPYKGAVVAQPPRLEEIETFYRIRIIMEQKMALSAMHRMNKQDFRQLEGILAQLKRLDLVSEEFFTLDWKFHTVIFEASGLSHLALIVHKLLDYTGTFLIFHQYDERDCTKFNEEHEQIIKALREKDAETLTSLIESNLLGGLSLVQGEYGNILKRPRP